MSTKGVVDIVFCLDASHSMQPCIDAVRRHVFSFVSSLEASPNQRRVDWRVDFLAYAADQEGNVFQHQSLHSSRMNVLDALYPTPKSEYFFTRDLAEFQRGLEQIEVGGDEATLLALDVALDYPWRPRHECHRVLVCLTDEPFETNAARDMQLPRLPELLDKIQKLGVMLFLIAPESDVYSRIGDVDKSEYETVDEVGNGLQSVAFDKVLAYMGKSVSMAGQVSGQTKEPRVRRALFGQDQFASTCETIRGR